MKVVCTSGYFDPLHIGHVRLFEEARALGDRLIVIVNNDEQAKLKKGKRFMPQEERLEVIRALRFVDEAILSSDTDETVLKTLEQVRPHVFAKGGDRRFHNTPEAELCMKLGIKLVVGVGGDKIQSSSALIHGQS